MHARCPLVLSILLPSLLILGCGKAADNAQVEKGQKTLAYWKKLDEIGRNNKPQGNTDAKVHALRTLADQLTALPTLGVDSDAVNSVLHFAGVVRRIADWVERSNQLGTAVDIFTESFLTGLTLGSYQGKTSDSLKAEQEVLMKEGREAQQQLYQTRAKLTERYGIEFPPLSD